MLNFLIFEFPDKVTKTCPCSVYVVEVLSMLKNNINKVLAPTKAKGLGVDFVLTQIQKKPQQPNLPNQTDQTIFFIVNYCDVLWQNVMYCDKLWHIVMYRDVLWCIVMNCENELWWIVMYYDVLW